MTEERKTFVGYNEKENAIFVGICPSIFRRILKEGGSIDLNAVFNAIQKSEFHRLINDETSVRIGRIDDQTVLSARIIKG